MAALRRADGQGVIMFARQVHHAVTNGTRATARLTRTVVNFLMNWNAETRWSTAIAATTPLTTMVGVAVLSASSAAVSQGPPQLVPEAAVLLPAIERDLDAAYLTPDERRDRRVFHGVWDERDLDRPSRRARAAIESWRLDDPSIIDPATPLVLRAEALLRRGRAEEALHLLAEVERPPAADAAEAPAADAGAAPPLADATSIEERTVRAALRARALELLGRRDEALAAAIIAASAIDDREATAPALVAAVEALSIRARLEDQPARDWHRMMEALGRARDLDRAYWPAVLAEGLLLEEKDNPVEAATALLQALSMNPRSSDAWYALGRFALARFDFDGARRASAALRRLSPRHAWADLLDARSEIVQNDPDSAAERLDALLRREPDLRDALALRAAADAMRYDEAGTVQWLEKLEALSPGSALGFYTVGRFLSLDRQYGEAADMLEEAIRRRPSWAAPRIELGLLEMQSGRDDRARAALREAARLDPFNKRSAFSLTLLDEMANWATLESEHFIIRYKPGVDEVVAAMMPEALDAMHRDVAGRFGHEPAVRTVIELMPDHRLFAVRITGMPWIHTIAACTGPVIALEVPREGAPEKHLGLFDWLEVLRHEYTHTITLSQTRNRIPHWLTEAAAVSMETKPRSWETCQMLAGALAAGELFDLDAINWAFVRPRRPTDRSLAYAQGHWMVEFMNERFGMEALPRLLERYFDGEPERVAIRNALGIDRGEFHQQFLEWARADVARWGLAPTPSLDELTDRLRLTDAAQREALEEAKAARLRRVAFAIADEVGAPRRGGRGAIRAEEWPPIRRRPISIPDDVLDQWLSEFPDHPDLLEIKIRRRMREVDHVDATSAALLEAYQHARPVDPHPHRLLARAALAAGDDAAAIPHLEALDRLEERSNSFAIELATLKRRLGDPAGALTHATKAVRIDPYNATLRELAAATAIEAGSLREAREHIRALTLLEPDRPQHRARMERIDQMLGTPARP
ncbi:MAG: tetratricopeptide repeat protein [Phycisphaeraceae bacterium]|nr:tetratricopeptide repeat protein [Phycisphaeraceae bacterium]